VLPVGGEVPRTWVGRGAKNPRSAAIGGASLSLSLSLSLPVYVHVCVCMSCAYASVTGDDGRGCAAGEEIPGGDRLAVKALQDGRGGVPGCISAIQRQSARHVTHRDDSMPRACAVVNNGDAPTRKSVRVASSQIELIGGDRVAFSRQHLPSSVFLVRSTCSLCHCRE